MTAAPLRVFVSTGEASGELIAADLIGAMRARGADIQADGIGNERLESAGVRLSERTTGWASMGPLDALGKIPKLIVVAARTAAALKARPVDLIVLVDFGAFNLRLARMIRAFGTKTPILYDFPPAAWLDDPSRARVVAENCDALTAFAHQRDFYRGKGLPITWMGHPLVSTIEPRSPRPAPPATGGVVALLPGSRAGEIARHTPRLLHALTLLRERRPDVTAFLAASDAHAQASLEEFLRLHSPLPVTIVRKSHDALIGADVAAIASGTAVLEAALLEVPTVAMYVLSKAQAKIARRIYHRKYITLPNLVLDEPIVPELLQEAATPQALAAEIERALQDPSKQLTDFRRLRAELGPPDALDRCARFALGLAGR